MGRSLSDTADADVAGLHHGSHESLLTDVLLTPSQATAPIDAVVVPSARPGHALRGAFQVSLETGCPVVVLCSHAARGAEAVKLADEAGVPLLAIDVREPWIDALPEFSADVLLAGAGFAPVSDLSRKRNLALLLGRRLGWQRILSLDDDIDVPDAARDLPRAAALLDDYDAVGLSNHDGYPDNSVVCHALRELGGKQSSFIGGGAMLIGTGTTDSFFPNIYNEDWFYLLGKRVPFRAARAGQMIQHPYDPFASPARAASEEFGDTLAEGLFWLLDEGAGLDRTAELRYWQGALDRRRRFLDRLLARTSAASFLDPSLRTAMHLSLAAARDRNTRIEPTLCREFVAAWRQDATRWGTHLATPASLFSDPARAALTHRSAALPQGFTTMR